MSRHTTIIITKGIRMDTLIDNPYLVRAVVAAMLLGPLCALIGVFVTARRMSFFSDTIAHAALAGVALGFLMGFREPTIPMVLFSLGVAVAMFWLRETTQLLTDTIMALLLSGSVALGVIILSALKGFRAQLHGYLFGDIQAVSDSELLFALVLVIGIGATLFYHLNGLALLTAQEEMAHVCGVRVRSLNYLFVGVLTLTVAASIRLLGVMLVTALVVIPPAAARNISRTLHQQVVFSLAVGVISGIGGVLLSYQFDFPAGPTVVLTAIGIFLTTLVAGRWISHGRVEAGPPTRRHA
jgi:ABC-type Mn2+/Zn2+ transport system permease subunit